MVVQAALAALFSRLGAGTDIAIGSPIAGRMDSALEELVGFFVNTLVLRTDTSGNPSFRELLARVRRSDLAAYANQDLPFEHLVEMLNPVRSLSHQPLFQVMLSSNNIGGTPFELPGISVRGMAVGDRDDQVRSDVQFWRAARSGWNAEGLAGQIEYASDLFDRKTVEEMGERLVRVLEQVAARSAGSYRCIGYPVWGGASADLAGMERDGGADCCSDLAGAV